MLKSDMIYRDRLCKKDGNVVKYMVLYPFLIYDHPVLICAAYFHRCLSDS